MAKKAYSKLSASGKYYRKNKGKAKRSGGSTKKRKTMKQLSPSGRAYRRAHS